MAGLMVIAACSSAEPLPANEYFPMVESELVRLDQATRDLTDRYATELESEMERLLAGIDPQDETSADRVLADVLVAAKIKMQSIITAHTGQLAVFAERVGELEPPDTVSSAHEELVDAFVGWAATGEATSASLGGVAGLAELPGIISGSTYADAQLRVDAACRALEPNATAVGVTLLCPGTQLGVLEVTP